MKRLSAKGAVKAMTLLEVLVILAILVILGMFLIPAVTDRPGRPRIQCNNNLRQITLGCILYAEDYTNRYPWQISAEGSVRTGTNGERIIRCFEAISMYIKNPKVFTCPGDNQRAAATTNLLTRTNLSYFINASATPRSNPAATVLFGDRNLESKGMKLQGEIYADPETALAWTKEIHRSRGWLAFADGHTELTTSDRLWQLFQQQSAITNHLLVP